MRQPGRRKNALPEEVGVRTVWAVATSETHRRIEVVDVATTEEAMAVKDTTGTSRGLAASTTNRSKITWA